VLAAWRALTTSTGRGSVYPDRAACSSAKRAASAGPSSPSCTGTSSSCPWPAYRARAHVRRSAPAPALRTRPVDARPHVGGGQRVGGAEHARERLAPVGRGGEPDRAQHARVRRHEHARRADALGERARVQRAAAAERDEHEPARVDAALDAHPAQRPRHRRVGRRDERAGDREHAGLARRRRAVHPLGQRAHGGVRPRRVERDAAAERARVDVPEHDVRVGHRGLRAAAPERRRPRHGAGAARTGPQGAGVVHPAHAAAAGRYRVDQHARQRDRHPGDVAAGLDERGAAENEADVGARAADVERERVGDAQRGAHRGRPDHAAGGPGERERRGAAGGLRRRAHAAAGRHHPGRRVAAGREPLDEPRHVARHPRARVRLGGRRRRALELRGLGVHLVRRDDGDARQRAGEGGGERPLVLGVGVGVQQRDRDRLGAERAHRGHGVAERRGGERRDDAPGPMRSRTGTQSARATSGGGWCAARS
jgi:hypothetical protein